MIAMPITVTFDTGPLATVVSPETSQFANGNAHGQKIRAALEAGAIQGFFSETLVTLEGIQVIDRVGVFGSTRIETTFSSNAPHTININLAVKQDRTPLPPKFLDRILAARQLGFKALKGPPRMGWIRAEDSGGTLFKSYPSVAELAKHLDKAIELATAIASRGVGHAVAVNLGLRFTERDNVQTPELWLQGLRRAKDQGEHALVARAIAEWADGDTIAAHYGHGIDLFCTEDFGKSRNGASILDNGNRDWLRETYGIQFITLAQLAQMV